MTRSSKKLVKTGVSIPGELYEEFIATLRSLGITSKSKGIQMALRSFIALNYWRSTENSKDVAGSILIIYSHENAHVEEVLTDIQHKHLDIIVSTLHVHLTKNKCMEIIVVKGKIPHIESLVRELGKAKLDQLIPLLTTY